MKDDLRIKSLYHNGVWGKPIAFISLGEICNKKFMYDSFKFRKFSSKFHSFVTHSSTNYEYTGWWKSFFTC